MYKSFLQKNFFLQKSFIGEPFIPPLSGNVITITCYTSMYMSVSKNSNFFPLIISCSYIGPMQL